MTKIDILARILADNVRQYHYIERLDKLAWKIIFGGKACRALLLRWARLSFLQKVGHAMFRPLFYIKVTHTSNHIHTIMKLPITEYR